MNDLSKTPVSELTFLIAEDDTFQRRWLTAMLANLGATNIVEADNGRTALEIFQDPSHTIDIGFIDLNMPDMDGIELVRHLAKEQCTASIALTSALGASLLFSVETMSKAYGIDLLGTFEKPATPEILKKIIGKYRTPRERFTAPDRPLPPFTLHEIRAGIDAGEFEPYFQPKVELTTGEVRSAEAFARWLHPEHGIVLPEHFIPLLEKNGEMDPLTWLMIDGAVKACQAWQDAGLALSVSINLSASSLAQSGLAEKIYAHIMRHGLDPQLVTFEITELMAMTDVPVSLENLARLRMKGFGLSVDDYGTGRSNMQQLLRIPFLDLKIDRTFVAGAAHNKEMRTALRSSLQLARKLHRHSVAVGVETREDWDLLCDMGCTFAQGFYIARPMEAAALPGWAEDWARFL